MSTILFDPFFVLATLLLIVVFRVVHYLNAVVPEEIQKFLNSTRTEDWLIPFPDQRVMFIVDLSQRMMNYKQCQKISFGFVCRSYLSQMEILIQNEWVEICGDSKARVDGILYPAAYRITDLGIIIRNAYIHREKIKIPIA